MSSTSSIEYLRSGDRGSWASRETDRLAVGLLSPINFQAITLITSVLTNVHPSECLTYTKKPATNTSMSSFDSTDTIRINNGSSKLRPRRDSNSRPTA